MYRVDLLAGNLARLCCSLEGVRAAVIVSVEGLGLGEGGIGRLLVVGNCGSIIVVPVSDEACIAVLLKERPRSGPPCMRSKVLPKKSASSLRKTRARPFNLTSAQVSRFSGVTQNSLRETVPVAVGGTGFLAARHTILGHAVSLNHHRHYSLRYALPRGETSKTTTIRASSSIAYVMRQSPTRIRQRRS